MFDNADKTVEKEQNSWAYMTFLLPSHCPNDVSGDMQEDEIPGGALSLNLLTTQTRDNVVAPHGRLNLRSRLHYRHNQEGSHEKFIRTCGGIGPKTSITLRHPSSPVARGLLAHPVAHSKGHACVSRHKYTFESICTRSVTQGIF